MTEEKKEVTVNTKKEIDSQKEFTIPGKKYSPATDIIETEAELKLFMDMPGVDKSNLTIKLEKNVLEIDGKIDSGFYEGLKPLYSEYNLGHFIRKFQISNEIDQSKIEANIENGVLFLNLPKVPEERPRLITVT